MSSSSSEKRSTIVNVESNTLDHTIVRAIAWTGAAMWVTQLFSWLATIYVARLLTPADYGVFAMAMVYVGLVTLVGEFGVGSAVLILRGLGSRQLAELNTVALMAGFLWFALSCALAYPLGLFFSSSLLPSIIVALSLGFLLSAPKVVPDSLLQQDLRFKLLAFMDSFRAFVQAGATVLAALAGLRYWSLVVGQLVGIGFGTVLTLAVRRHRLAWPHFRSLKPAVGLGWNLVVMRLGWYLYSNADFLIAGRVLGETPLGFYRLAWSISNIPVDKVSVMVMKTSLAFFASVQQEYESMRRYLVGLTEGLALLTIPASAGLALVSDEFVMLLLGPSWAGVISPLRLLALYAAVRSLTPLIAPVLNVTGNSGFAAWNTVWASLVLPIGFYFSSRWGATGIAAAWVVMYPFTVVPLYLRAFHKIELPFRRYFRALWAPTSGTLVLTVLVLIVKYRIPPDWPLSVRLILLTLTGLVSYLGFLMLFHADKVRDFKKNIAMLRGNG